MYTLGIDIGSASSKAVILKDGTDVVASAVVQVGTGTSGPGRVLEEVFSNVDLTQEDMDYTVATGYGRFSVENADKQLSEITCHAKGIFTLCHLQEPSLISVVRMQKPFSWTTKAIF